LSTKDVVSAPPMFYKVAAAAVARRATPKGVLKAGGGCEAG